MGRGIREQALSILILAIFLLIDPAAFAQSIGGGGGISGSGGPISGGVQIGGDIGGTNSSPTVAKIGGATISPLATQTVPCTVAQGCNGVTAMPTAGSPGPWAALEQTTNSPLPTASATLACINPSGNYPDTHWYSGALSGANVTYTLPSSGCIDNASINVTAIQDAAHTVTFTTSASGGSEGATCPALGTTVGNQATWRYKYNATRSSWVSDCSAGTVPPTPSSGTPGFTHTPVVTSGAATLQTLCTTANCADINRVANGTTSTALTLTAPASTVLTDGQTVDIEVAIGSTAPSDILFAANTGVTWASAQPGLSDANVTAVSGAATTARSNACGAPAANTTIYYHAKWNAATGVLTLASCGVHPAASSYAQVGGDLGGTSASPTIARIGGATISPLATQTVPCTVAQGCTGQTAAGQAAAQAIGAADISGADINASPFWTALGGGTAGKAALPALGSPGSFSSLEQVQNDTLPTVNTAVTCLSTSAAGGSWPIRHQYIGSLSGASVTYTLPASGCLTGSEIGFHIVQDAAHTVTFATSATGGLQGPSCPALGLTAGNKLDVSYTWDAGDSSWITHCGTTVPYTAPGVGISTFVDAGSPYIPLSSDQMVDCNCSSGACQFNLPQAGNQALKRRYEIKNISSTQVCNVAPSAGDSINGSTSNIALGTNETVSVQERAATFWDKVLTANASDVVSGNLGVPVVITLTNNTTTGPVTSELVTSTGVPSTATVAPASTTNGIQGVCVSNCTNSGSSKIQILGLVNCVFDNASTAGHFVTISTSLAGECHDAGATQPTGVPTVGIVQVTNASAGTNQIQIGPPMSSLNAGGVGVNSGVAGNPTFYASSGAVVSGIGGIVHCGSGTLDACKASCPTIGACHMIGDPGITYTNPHPFVVGDFNSSGTRLLQTLDLDSAGVNCTDTTTGNVDTCIVLLQQSNLQCEGYGISGGNGHITAASSANLDNVVATMGEIQLPAWVTVHAYLLGQMLYDSTANKTVMVTVAGTSGGTLPTFSPTIGLTVTDGGVTWKTIATGRIGSITGQVQNITGCNIGGNTAASIHTVVHLGGSGGGRQSFTNSNYGAISTGGTGLLIDSGTGSTGTGSGATLGCCVMVSNTFLGPQPGIGAGPAYGVRVTGANTTGTDIEGGQIADINGTANVALLSIDGTGVYGTHVGGGVYFEMGNGVGESGTDGILISGARGTVIDNFLLQRNGSSNTITNCFHITGSNVDSVIIKGRQVGSSPCVTNLLLNDIPSPNYTVPAGSNTLKYDYTSPSNTAGQVFDSTLGFAGGFTFANIGTYLTTDGEFGYCNNCTIASPCAGGGTGAIAKRLNGVNVCN